MLLALGYAMVLTFMVLIMTKRMSALVALALVPIAFGLAVASFDQVGKMMIDAAVAAYSNGTGVFKHFILSSVLNSQFSKMLNHDCKRTIEEWIMESGIPYTILQPSTFMDNMPVAMLAQQEKPVFPALWSTENRFSMLAPKRP